MGELNYTIIAKASLSGNMIQTVKAKQGDQQSRFVKTTILKDAQEPYIIPDGITAWVAFKKPDGTQVFQEAIVTGASEVTFELTKQMLAVPGKAMAEIILKKEDAILSTAMLKVMVLEQILDGERIESEDDYQGLLETIGKAESAAEKAEQAANKVNDAILDLRDGATYIPNVSAEGIISWTNEQGLKNPDPINIKGPQGTQGAPGPTGKAASIQIGKVSTLEPGQPATVTNTGTDTDAVLNFGIPRGVNNTGESGNLAEAIISNAEGSTIQLTDSSDRALQGLTVYGKSTQDGEPDPDNPIAITNIGDNDDIIITLTDNNTTTQQIALSTAGGLAGVPTTSGGNVTMDGQQYVSETIQLYSDGTGKRITPVKTLVLDGSESYSVNASSTNTTRFYISVADIKGSLAPALCSHAKYKEVWGGDEVGFYLSSNYIVFRMPKAVVGETKDSVQQWIASQHSAGTPLTVIYQTATSAESELQKEEIPQIQSVYTHYPNTTISNNNNTYLGVHYVVDTKMYIDRKFAELQQSIVTTQQQLL